MDITDPGIKFRDIPDVTMVYISEFVLFGEGYTTYHVDRILRETGETVDNGMMEVYLELFCKAKKRESPAFSTSCTYL